MNGGLKKKEYITALDFDTQFLTTYLNNFLKDNSFIKNNISCSFTLSNNGIY